MDSAALLMLNELQLRGRLQVQEVWLKQPAASSQQPTTTDPCGSRGLCVMFVNITPIDRACFETTYVCHLLNKWMRGWLRGKDIAELIFWINGCEDDWGKDIAELTWFCCQWYICCILAAVAVSGIRWAECIAIQQYLFSPWPAQKRFLRFLLFWNKKKTLRQQST
jgi:hypothetical protein